MNIYIYIANPKGKAQYFLYVPISERQGGELKSVDMLLLDVKVIKKSLYSNFLKSRFR